MTNNGFDELESLLFDWEDGVLDDAGVDRVREILRNDEQAQAHYVRLQMVGAAIKLDGDAGLLPQQAFSEEITSSCEPPSPQRSPASERGSSFRAKSTEPKLRTARALNRWMLIAAALLICVLAGRVIQLELTDDSSEQSPTITSTDERDASKEATSQGVALMTRLVDVAWGDNQRPLEVGDAIPPGRLAIESGYVQVEFFCGATVILEGPAELDLQSPMLARVRHGKLRAHVPPAARGFSLEVDDMTVVDLGTEFGLSVNGEGANVQVFDGEVEIARPSEATQLLTKGQALVRDASGAFENTEVTPERFVDVAALESHVRNQRDQRYDRWKAWSDEIRGDSRLIAYYSFDGNIDWQRRLPCDLVPANNELDGAIVGARRVDGRWPAKRALEFKQPGDRVRVQISGEFSSLTFACWVRIDSLDRWFNSLFLTDGYDEGEPHWQILDSGQLYFSVRPARRDKPGPRDFKSLSPPFWNATLSGRWIHLAVVYNVESRSISHYLNGELLSADTVPAEKVVATKIGTASIGNWSVPTQPNSEFAIRNLNGSFDELAIFAAALTADEIKGIYENGKP